MRNDGGGTLSKVNLSNIFIISHIISIISHHNFCALFALSPPNLKVDFVKISIGKTAHSAVRVHFQSFWCLSDKSENCFDFFNLFFLHFIQLFHWLHFLHWIGYVIIVLFGCFQLCVGAEGLGQLINPLYCVVWNCETWWGCLWQPTNFSMNKLWTLP